MKPHCLLGLLLIANSILVSTSAQEPAAGGYFNVRSFGAIGDGKTLDSPSINNAIDAATKASGGTVLIPAGTYLCGSIHLASNIHLLIDAGAILVGAPQSMNAYDETEPFQGPAYQDGGHTYFHNSLIWGENLTNVSITGSGRIEGGGLVTDDGNEDQMSGFANLSADSKKKIDAPPLSPTVTYQPQRLGNKAIALKSCTNVLLRDITIVHGGHFAVLVTGCNNMTIDNVTADTNRDGIDIDCCRDTMVSNCLINAPFDDALCIKSSFALGKNVLTENLTITNCQVSGYKEGSLIDGTLKPNKQGHSRIKLGTESNGGYRNVAITNCTFHDCRGLALEEVDGGIMENITVSNLTMTNVTDYPIYVTTGKRNRGPNIPSPSGAKNILISNVVASNIDPLSGIQITGLAEQPIEGIRLENIRLSFKGGGTAAQAAAHFKELGSGYPDPSHLDITPAYGIYARHVQGLELANITVDYQTDDERPPIACEDVSGLEIDNLKAKVATGVPSSNFINVADPVIRNSPILQASH